jgi:hypothetical protein
MDERQKPEIELHPDAWKRFRRAVKAIGKAGPQHREPKQAAQKKRRRSPTRRS